MPHQTRCLRLFPLKRASPVCVIAATCDIQFDVQWNNEVPVAANQQSARMQSWIQVQFF